MSFLSRIFSDKGKKSQETPQKTEPIIAVPTSPTSEYASLLQFTNRRNELLLDDKYLARSDYRCLIDDYADTPFDNIVPPPIVRNGERFPLPFWNKLSDKVKVFLKEQWGINCENEYNKLLNDMEEVYILEHALKNYGLI